MVVDAEKANTILKPSTTKKDLKKKKNENNPKNDTMPKRLKPLELFKKSALNVLQENNTLKEI